LDQVCGKNTDQLQYVLIFTRVSEEQGPLPGAGYALNSPSYALFSTPNCGGGEPSEYVGMCQVRWCGRHATISSICGNEQLLGV
jgi:hypothetical protein